MKQSVKFLFIAAAMTAALHSCETPTQPPTAPLTLSVDNTTIPTSGEAAFIVMQNGANVTDKIQVCTTVEGQETTLAEPVFRPTKEGTYEFYAYLKDEAAKPDRVVSNTVQVVVENKDMKFQKNVIFFTFTGTWCKWCYVNKGSINQLKENFGDKVVSMNFYDGTSNIMVKCLTFNKFANQLIDNGHDFSGALPAAIADMTTFFMGAADYDKVLPIYEALAAEDAMTGISVDSKIEGSKVNVSIGIVAEKSNSYGVNVFLVEDNLVCAQATPDTTIKEYNHTDVVRKSAVENIFGDDLGTLAEGERVTKTFTLDLDTWHIVENMSVVVCTSYTDADGKEYMQNTKTGEIHRVRKARPRYLNLVDTKRK